MIDFRQAPIGSPEWWLARLMHRLEGRAAEMRRYDDYYNGIQPLAFASEKFRDAFGDRFRAFSSNFMALVVDGTRERLEVQGFRFQDPLGDKDLWSMWQANDLDAGSQLAHTEALIKGMAYTLIEPNGKDTPRITVEDPLDCIVAHAAKDRGQRLAGLKRWVDDDGHLVIYVYLPEAVFKYRSDKAWPTPIPGWPAPSIMTDVQQSVADWGGLSPLETPDEEWPLPNPLGVVPIVPLPNRPRLKGHGQSEIAPVMSNQDAVNKYRADALVAAEFVAYPQRYALNLELERDPDTGRAKEPFKAGMHLWVVPPPDPEQGTQPPVELGQFAAADLGPYQEMIQTEVGHIASISRMPYHYLLGQPQSVPPSGESLKSSEAGLTKKVNAAAIHLGEGWEETMRVALRATNDSRADQRIAETIWADPETRNEAVRTDAIIKQFQAGLITLEIAQEMIGYSPAQIERMADQRDAVPAAPVEPKIMLQMPGTKTTKKVLRDAMGQISGVEELVN